MIGLAFIAGRFPASAKVPSFLPLSTTWPLVTLDNVTPQVLCIALFNTTARNGAEVSIGL